MRIFVPLGAGDHVDHQLAFELGRCFARNGVEVWAYEDCPYIIHTPERHARRLKQVGNAVCQPDEVPVGDLLDSRIAAIACYKSQLPVISASLRTSRALSAIFACQTGVGELAERFRRIRP